MRQLDVGDEASVAAALDATAAELGVPDILVNNAGVGAGGTNVADMTTDEFDRVIKTDLYGPFLFPRVHPPAKECWEWRQDHQHHLST